jgi:hypothetical protein
MALLVDWKVFGNGELNSGGAARLEGAAIKQAAKAAPSDTARVRWRLVILSALLSPSLTKNHTAGATDSGQPLGVTRLSSRV